MFVCHVVLSVLHEGINVRQKSAARDAVHNSPDDFEHSSCLYGPHHSVSGLSLQQPLCVQGLVLCNDFRVQQAAMQTLLMTLVLHVPSSS